MGRRCNLVLKYKGVNISAEIEKDLISAPFDQSINEIDSFDVEILDRDKKWLNDYLPQKGDKVEAYWKTLGFEGTPGYNNVFIGEFTVDTIEYQMPPYKIKLRTLSVDTSSKILTEFYTKTWTNCSLKKIATDIAKDCGLELVYRVSFERTYGIVQQEKRRAKEELRYEESENMRSQETYWDLLKRLCNELEINIKLFNNKKLILAEEAMQEKSKIVDTIYIEDISTPATFETSDSKIYNKCELYYKDPKSREIIKSSFYIKDIKGYSEQNERTLKKVYSQEVTGKNKQEKEAYLKKIASKMLKKENNKNILVNIDLLYKGIFYYPGDTVLLSNFGKLVNGKYIVQRTSVNLKTGVFSLGMRQCNWEGYEI